MYILAAWSLIWCRVLLWSVPSSTSSTTRLEKKVGPEREVVRLPHEGFLGQHVGR